MCGAGEADGLRAVLRLAHASSTSSRCRTSSSATTTRRSTSLRPLRPALELVRLGGVPPARPDGRAASSTTSACAASSASRRCTPAWPRTRRSPSTPSSPTWTPSTACSSPRAACTRCPVALGRRGRRGAGVEFRYGAPVERILLADGTTRAGRGVRLADGEVVAADAVVCNPDLPVAYRTLLPGTRAAARGAARPTTRRRPSSGTSGVAGRAARRAPRTTTSTSATTGTTRSGRSSHDGAACPTRRSSSACRRSTSRRMAPAGRHALYVLEPVPNLDGAVDWTTEARAGPATTCSPPSAGSATRPTSRSRSSSTRSTGRRRAWSGARRSPCRTGSARPGRSGPATSSGGRPGWCSPAPAPFPGVGVPMVLVSGMLAAERVASRPMEAAPMTTITLDASPTPAAGQLNRRYGTTYYWSTYALPAVKRHHVWALYALLPPRRRHRRRPRRPVAVEVREKALRRLRRPVLRRPRRRRTPTTRCSKAVVHTVRAFDIDPECFRRFLRSMAMDLTVDRVRHLGRPARLHGRLGRRHRRDDAADPRAAVAGRARATPATSASPSSSRTSSATSPRTSTAAGSTCRRRTSTGSAPTRTPDRRRRVAGADALRDRAVPRALPIGRPRACDCCRPPRPAASAAARDALLRDPRPHRGRRLRRVHHRATVPTWRKAGAVARVAVGDEPAAGRVDGRGLVAGLVAARPTPAAASPRSGAPGRARRASARRSGSRSVSVVVPARNEASDAPRLLGVAARPSTRPHEVIVVDDGSTDGTAPSPARTGRRSSPRRPCPPGWLGKPWACHVGAERGHRRPTCCSSTPTPGWRPDALARLVAAHAGPDGLLSVQPYHRIERRLRAAVGASQHRRR